MNSFSDFAVAQSLSPLPVEWLSVRATPLQHQIRLDWSIIPNPQNAKFVILKSLNGTEWSEAITVPAISDLVDYVWTDEDVNVNQRYFYQIRQVDYDGKTSYSIRILQKVN